MAPVVVVRRAEPAEVPVLAALMQMSFPDDTGERWRNEDLAGAAGLAGAFACLATVNDEPVGFALARAIAGEAELLLLGVVPRWRRQGVAAALIRQVTFGARACGAEALFLELRAGNQAAQALYRQQGFAMVGERKAYYKTSSGFEDAITMKRSLNCQEDISKPSV